MSATPHLTIGVLVIGFDIALIIYGVTCLQTVQYFRRFRSDMFFVKFAVTAVWVLETVNTCLAAHSIMHYTMLYRTAEALPEPPPWSLPTQSSFNSILSSVVHIMLGWRIWVFSGRNATLISCIAILSIAQLVCGCAITVIALGEFPGDWNHRRRTMVRITSSLLAATDVLVTFSFCYFLQIRKTANTTSSNVINKVIFLAIHNGILSCSLALLALITALAAPKTWLMYASCFVLGKAYFNTLLSTLNQRTTLREMLQREMATVGIGTTTIRRQLGALRTTGDEFGVQEENWDNTI